MIPHQNLTGHIPNWQSELANAVTDIEELAHLLDLEPRLLASEDATRQFSLRVPHSFIARMKKGDPNDPLLLQVLPDQREMLATPGYSPDPLGESAVNPVPGLIHKYHGRVLLLVSPACAVHCRYCFRRHFPYADNTPGREHWNHALNYIAAEPSITEVIYSGGDPLAANDQLLLWLTKKIAAISHVKRLRIHTRLPVVIPSRINASCLHWLTATRLQAVVVLHSNHRNEINTELATAVALLRKHNILIFNQSVLLGGINDRPAQLFSLSERLFEIGVMPYYLHCMDPVAGAAHFDLEDARIQSIYQELQDMSPGYLVPKLVKEMPGAASKTFINNLKSPSGPDCGQRKGDDTQVSELSTK